MNLLRRRFTGVSGSKTANARKRKPYKQPAIKKQTLKEAKKMLEAQPDPADENSKKMVEEIDRRLARK